jgi:hypothetical protein
MNEDLPTLVCVYRRDHCRCTGDSDGEDDDCPHVIHAPVYYGFYKNKELAKFLANAELDNDELTDHEEQWMFHLLNGLPSLEAYLDQLGIARVVDPNDENVRKRAAQSVQTFNRSCRSEVFTVSRWIAFNNEHAQKAYDHHVSKYNQLSTLRDGDAFLTSAEAENLWDSEKSGHQYKVYITNGVCTVF